MTPMGNTTERKPETNLVIENLGDVKAARELVIARQNLARKAEESLANVLKPSRFNFDNNRNGKVVCVDFRNNVILQDNYPEKSLVMSPQAALNLAAWLEANRAFLEEATQEGSHDV